MSTQLRVLGSEVQVRFTVNGQLEKTIVDIKSSTMTIVITKKMEDFLGRGSKAIDEQFENIDGNLVFQPRSQDALQLAEKIMLRAQRATSQDLLKINLISTLTFPNGQRPKIMVPDMKFGPIPVNAGGRDSYVDITFDWSAETFGLQTT